MKLKTNIAVTYNNGIASQTSNILEGTLILCNDRVDSDSLNFLFEYKTEEGSLVKSGNFEISEPEINTLYEAVKELIPNGLSYKARTRMLYYLGFKIQMAQTFGIELANIDLITE